MKSGAGKSGKTERKIVAPFSGKTHFIRKTRSKTGSSCIRSKFFLLVYLVWKTFFSAEQNVIFTGKNIAILPPLRGPVRRPLWKQIDGNPKNLRRNSRKLRKNSKKLQKNPKKRRKNSKNLQKNLQKPLSFLEDSRESARILGNPREPSRILENPSGNFEQT